MNSSLYQPAEDTYLILEQVRKFAKGKILDMGTGTGILALEAQPNSKFVVALDINPEAVKFVQNLIILKRVNNVLIKDSNLFSFLDNNYVDFDRKSKQFTFKFFKDKRTRFDTIIFNPPYLPKQKGEDVDVELFVSGGKKGYELLENFFDQLNEYLENDGNTLIVFSSLTNKNRVDEALHKFGFEFEILSTEKIPFEELYCYRIFKSDILKALDKKGLRHVQLLAKGHRGIVYTADFKGKKVVVKKERTDIDAKGCIANEVNMLKILNKKGIGPKLIFNSDGYFVYNYIDGVLIKDFIETQEKDALKKVLFDVFSLMYKLDKMNIDKEEMHHPLKHVIIDKDLNVYLIDFERANKTDKPKNVTQFVQYVCSIQTPLNNQGFKIDVEKLRDVAKVYKHDMSSKNYNEILKLVN